MEIKKINQESNLPDNGGPESRLQGENQVEKDWEAAKNGFFDLRNEIYKLSEQKGGWEMQENYYNKIANFTRMLREEFLDYSKYISWHVIAGSTSNFELSPKMDFPPPHSVIDFLQKLRQELE